MQPLDRDELQTMLHRAEEQFPHGACNTCECFLGYLAQLRIDSDAANKALFLPSKCAAKTCTTAWAVTPARRGVCMRSTCSRNKNRSDHFPAGITMRQS